MTIALEIGASVEIPNMFEKSQEKSWQEKWTWKNFATTVQLTLLGKSKNEIPAVD